jgi:single-strand DNA-binding protein
MDFSGIMLLRVTGGGWNMVKRPQGSQRHPANGRYSGERGPDSVGSRPKRIKTAVNGYFAVFYWGAPRFVLIKFKRMNNLSNSVRLTGRLGAAPELKVTDNEKKWAKLSLATHFFRKNAMGELQKETHWHQLILWEKQAEIAEKYLDKGSKIAIEGRLVNRHYTDKEGAKHQVTEIVVNELMLLGKLQEN